MAKAFDGAMRLLSRREHGAIELCNKLKQKGHSQDEVQEALAKCQELDLQSDARFAEIYCRSRIRQGYGPVKISQELNAKGIHKDLIQSVIRQEEEQWFEYALAVWQKKSKGQQEMSFSELQKQQHFLLYRGFGTDTIAAVVRELAIEVV